MSLNKNEIGAFEKLEISEKGIEKINNILLTEIIQSKKITINVNNYIVYLFMIIGLLIYAFYLNSNKIGNLASFATMILPIIFWISGLLHVKKERYKNEEVILNKNNLYFVFNIIFKDRIKKLPSTKYNLMINLWCHLLIISGLIMFEHCVMLIIFIILLILVLIVINEKMKLVQSDFVKEINAIRE